MKFVLAFALVLTTSLFAFSQNPQPDRRNAPPETQNAQISLIDFVDSLRSDPAFQEDMAQLAEDLLSAVGLSPLSILHRPLPDFSLTDLQGNTLTNEHLFGQVTFLLIWDVEGQPSPESFQQLNELREAYRHQEVRFLALTAVPAKWLQHALKSTALQFQYLPAANHLISELGFLPQHILVDRDGIIRYTTANFSDLMLNKDTLDLLTLREEIDDLLVE